MSSIEKLNTRAKDAKTNENLLETPDNSANNRGVINESPKVALDKISLAFLNSNPSQYSEIEMEAKFGTRGIKYLTKMTKLSI